MKSLFNFKTIILLLVTFALFSSCNQTEKSTETSEKNSLVKRVNFKKDTEPYHISPNATANKKLVIEYVEALIAADAVKLRNSVGPGFMDYGPGMQDSANIEQIVVNWTRFKKNRSNQKHGIFAMTALESLEPGPAKGDWVQVWGIFTGKENAVNKEFTIPYNTVALIENNKIVMSRSFYDLLETSLHMGAVKPVER